MSPDFQWNGQVTPTFKCFTDTEVIKQAQERVEKQMLDIATQSFDRGFTAGYHQAMIDISTGFQTLDDCHRIAQSQTRSSGSNVG